MDHTPREVAYDRLFQGRGYRLRGETFEPVPSHGAAETPPGHPLKTLPKAAALRAAEWHVRGVAGAHASEDSQAVADAGDSDIELIGSEPPASPMAIEAAPEHVTAGQDLDLFLSQTALGAQELVDVYNAWLIVVLPKHRHTARFEQEVLAEQAKVQSFFDDLGANFGQESLPTIEIEAFADKLRDFKVTFADLRGQVKLIIDEKATKKLRTA